jgi:hypothetical protein
MTESSGSYQLAALLRIAYALEKLAARKPAPRVLVLPVPTNTTPEQGKQLAQALQKALEEE